MTYCEVESQRKHLPKNTSENAIEAKLGEGAMAKMKLVRAFSRSTCSFYSVE